MANDEVLLKGRDHRSLASHFASLNKKLRGLEEMDGRLKRPSIFSPPLENVSLSRYTTLGIGGAAPLFYEARNDAQLKKAIVEAREEGIPFLVMGSGSNLLVSDRGFQGLVIRDSVEGIKVFRETLRVKGGTLLQELVDFANRAGRRALEKMAGIPGTVAGAICGNAGAFGQVISDRLVRVTVFDGRHTLHLLKSECGFTYRGSVFKKESLVILEAKFRLEKEDPESLSQTSQEILKLRGGKYQEGLKSPGSFFKNFLVENLSKEALLKIPPEKIAYGKVPAGYLLEAVGAKGKSLGGVQIASYHGNLFLNKAGGTAQEFLALAREYQIKVREKFGVVLEPEVTLVGFEGEKSLWPESL